MLMRLARFVLLVPLVLSVPLQGFAAVGGLCGVAGHDGTHGLVIGHGSASAHHPGQSGDNPGERLADSHCAVGAAIPLSIVAFVAESSAGNAVPAIVAIPPAFIPPGLDRPPLSLLV